MSDALKSLEPYGSPGRIQRPALGGLPENEISVPSRLTAVFLGLLYMLLFRQVYWSYISVEWGYTGLIYRDLNFFELAFIYLSVSVVSWFVPIRMDRPSSVIIWFLYAIIYVPTMSITLMIGMFPAKAYVADLLALSVGMIIICRTTRYSIGELDHDGAQPGPNFARVILVVFLVLSLTIFFYFKDIMTFASIDDVYVQRFVAADMTSGVTGYARAYYGYLLSPLMIAMGVCNRARWGLAALGVAGFIMSYMIDASKISLVIPLIMIGAGLLFSWRGLKLYHLTGAMIFLCLLSATLTSSTRLVRFLADLVLLRTVSIPAQTFAQYFDVFYQKGYTWWSNVTGLNLVLPVPAAFRSDQFWPVLGQIVGAEYYGFASRVNLNANPFVGEGVAAGGWVGVIVISAAISLFLYALDKLSIGWDRRFVLVLMVPIGLTLTNVHLSTFLVSFGGLAWLLMFRFYKPPHPARARPVT